LYLTVPRLGNIHDAPDIAYKRVGTRLREQLGPVVVRTHGRAGDDLKRDPALVTDLLGRLDRDRFLLLEWLGSRLGYSLVEVRPGLHLSELGPEKAGPWISALRSAEMTDWSTRLGALLPANREFHYEGPNGNHYDSFLRPGFAFGSVDDLDAGAFWLGDYVEPDSLIIVDTWNLSALALNLAEYVRICDPKGRTAPPPVESIEGYDAGARRFAVHAARVSSERDLKQILLIVSVNSTGVFATRYRDALRKADPATRVDVVCLYATDKAGIPNDAQALHVLTGIANRMDPATCRLCLPGPDKSPPIRVLPSSYLMELSAALSQARIQRTNASKPRDFFGRYSGTGAITVHRDQHDGLRHHMIHVDVQRLLGHHMFKRRLREAGLKIPRPVDVVLTPEHSAAKAIGMVLARQLSAHPVSADEMNLFRLDAARRDRLLRARRIVIADDVAISGTRLSAYQRALHEAGVVSHRENVDLWGVVGVARPPSTEARRGIQDLLGSQLLAVEDLLLPDWESEDECPWCVELERMNAHIETIGRHPTLRARHERLLESNVGLDHDLFLQWSIPVSEAKRRRGRSAWEDEARRIEAEQATMRKISWDLGPNSIFGELQEVEVFTAVAASLQALRDQGDLHPGELQTPLAKVLDPYLYLLGRFYDPVIVASLLRAGRRHDFRAARVERLLTRAVGLKLRDSTYQSLRAELLLAVSLGKLPRPDEIASRRKELLSGEPGTCALLAALLGAP